MSVHRRLLSNSSALVSLFAFADVASSQQAPQPLPEVTVTAPSPIVRRAPAHPRPTVTAAPSRPSAPAPQPAPAPVVAAPPAGTLPIVVDQFATVTVVPNDEIRRTAPSTLGDLLFSKPGITGSSFAPGASSRPIIRGLDVNRVRIQEDGIGANGASDLGEDHFVPVDPLTTNQVEVIRGPATLRFGSQAIGGVVETTNNRIPEALPCRTPAAPPRSSTLITKAPLADPGCVSAEVRGAATTVDNGLNGAFLLDTGKDNFAFHADASGRKGDDYRVPSYPYLVPPDPVPSPRATQPNAFNGRQPNSSLHTDGYSLGGSYLFDGGFAGIAYTRTNNLYHIPGIDGENSNTRIDAHQDKVLTKGEMRTPVPWIDMVRFWGGITDYTHHEIGLSDPTDLSSDGIRQTFTNKEQEGRVEATLMPFNLRFAELTTAIGVQGGRQELTAPSPDNAGLWDPNSNHRIAGYVFNELKFTPTTKAQVSGRIEQIDLSGAARSFLDDGTLVRTSASSSYMSVSAAAGLIQELPWNVFASLTAQHVERAPKPAELFSGGGHDATVTFDKGNPNLTIEKADSIEAGLRRAQGPFRFELTAYYTRFTGFIFRSLTGNTCNGDTGFCGPGADDLKEAIYSQRDAIFRGGEFQGQYDVLPIWTGMFGVEAQGDIVRATFTDGTNVPRIPPVRAGGGVFWRDDNWLVRSTLIHAWAHKQIDANETPTPGFNLLKAELSYRWKAKAPRSDELIEFSVGIVGDNLLNEDIRNSVSYTKDEVLLPGRAVRLFANAKY